jgi:serine/threonine protein kinase
VYTADVIQSSGYSWILDGHLITHVWLLPYDDYYSLQVKSFFLKLYQGDLFGDKKMEVKVKVVSMEKASLLRRELSALKVLTGSKYFVNLMRDYLLSSDEFTVVSSPGGGSNDLRFDNHIAMVMEKGIITLDDYIRHHSSELAWSGLLSIISCLFNMVMAAHTNKVVIMDIKGSNVMLFESGKGLYVWKGIDLDGSLPVDTLLDESSFFATVSFMAPELFSRDKKPLRAQFSLDVWSLGILIFNVLVCKQGQTFWTLLGKDHDTEIKDEILGGTFTQQKVDEHVARNFPGHSNSTPRHFLQHLLKVNPVERSTLQCLQNSALLTGVASISASTLYNNQAQIISDLKSLSEFIKTEIASVHTALSSLLDDDDSVSLGELGASLESLRSVLEEQARSSADCKTAIQRLSVWQSSDVPPTLTSMMGTVTKQLQTLLSAADEQKLSFAQSKELLHQLSTDVSGVQEQVQAVRDDLLILQETFVSFGEYVRKELAENSQHNALVLEKLTHVEQMAIMIAQEQKTSKADTEKTIQSCEQLKVQMEELKLDTTEIDKKIEINTRLLNTLVQNTHDVPTLMVLLPVLRKGWRRFSPTNFLSDEANLVFICGHTKELVPCGPKGCGYRIKTLKSWVRKAVPVLKVGLMLLQVGLICSGIPIPLAGVANTVLTQADRMSYLRSALGLLQEKSTVDSVELMVDSMDSSSMDKVAEAIRALDSGSDRENIRSAYEAIWAILKEVDPTLLYIGLSKEVSESGRVVWVKKDAALIKQFKESNGP